MLIQILLKFLAPLAIALGSFVFIVNKMRNIVDKLEESASGGKE
jgi:hypothetical protein